MRVSRNRDPKCVAQYIMVLTTRPPKKGPSFLEPHMATAWALKGLLNHDFGVYVYACELDQLWLWVITEYPQVLCFSRALRETRTL